MNNSFKKLGGFIVILLVIAGVFFVSQNVEQQPERNFPKVENKVEHQQQTDQTSTTRETQPESLSNSEHSKRVNFQWGYDNQKYELAVTLYGSINDYYSEQPKKYSYAGERPENWEQKYYSMFLDVPEQDQTFSKLASELEQIGKKNRLTEDEIVELTVAFVQSIPYDESKSTSGSFLARYPYQVLYDDKGVCSEKSFLAALLIRELDYGVSLFSFEQAKHMVIGIKCPERYDSYDSGYCFTELTTPGWKIGVEDFKDIENIISTRRTSLLKETPEIYEVADGKTYTGVAETMEQKQRTKTLKEQIEQLEVRISNLREDLEHYRRTEDYQSYNELLPTYNKAVSEHKEKVKQYNNLIEEFSPGD